MKQKITDVKNFICGNGKVTKGEWAVLTVTLILPLISFMYMDTDSIIRCSIDVGKSIFDGEFWDFYAYSERVSYQKLMGHLPSYDIVFYITVAIWQLPIAIIEYVTGEALRFNLAAMIYSKLFLMVCLLAATWMVRKIALELRISKKNATWAAFMFMSSGMMYSYVCITGQYDIMGVFFCLVGVYFYIKNDMLKFALMFALAIQYKFFAIFIFFPLILLRVKNIWRVISYLILPAATVILFKLPFLNDGQAIAGKNEIDAGMVERLFGNTLTIFETEVPLSLLAFGGVCIWCFFNDDKKFRGGVRSNLRSVFVAFCTVFVLPVLSLLARIFNPMDSASLFYEERPYREALLC